MKKELRALLNEINAKKEEVRELAADGKLEEAKAAKKELQDMSERFNILADLEDDETDQAERGAKEGKGRVSDAIDTAKKQVSAFVNAIKSANKEKPVADEDREILNAMSEGSDEDGGLTVRKTSEQRSWRCGAAKTRWKRW